MQMYDNEDVQSNDQVRREKRKKKYRKPQDVNDNGDEILEQEVTQNINKVHRKPEISQRRSEEENYEPGNESRHKHRHRHNKTEEDDTKEDGGDDVRSAEEQEEARRQRREKKKRARDRERKKSEEDPHQNVTSPINGGNDYKMNKIAEPYYEENEDEVQYEEQEEESLYYEDEQVSTPPEVNNKPKTKKGGFGRIFASFKKKIKIPRNNVENNDQWEPNPEIFNPSYENHSKTEEKLDKNFRMAHVILLDGEEVAIKLDHKAVGGALFDKVCDDLDLIEKDFFGMTFVIGKLQTWFWLEMDKKIIKQLGKDDDWTFNFQVKFYPPEPILLQEDLTRYLLSLQVRQDVYTGKLPCSWITQALLGSFLVQSELGDYDELENDCGIDYLREFEFVLNQSEQLLEKICELHKKHVGMTPDRADIKYLETSKRLEQYGVDLHPARDNDDVEIFIGISYQGILIYRDRMRIGRFAWPKVLRISYKKNYFYLKIRSERYDDKVAIVGFKLFNHNLAKRLWRNAAEQHTFFRMKEPQSARTSSRFIPASKPNAVYSGLTLHQYRNMNVSRVVPAIFNRSMSKRKTIGSMPTSLNRAGMQYSSMHSLNRAHPRDMTLGKAKSVEYLSSKRPGSAIGLTFDREGSLSIFNQPRQIQQSSYQSYSSVKSYKDDDRRQSFRSGDSLNGGESYTVNHDDHMSLPSLSNKLQDYSKYAKKERPRLPSQDLLSDDGIISTIPKNKIIRGGRTNKMAPLPVPPDLQTSDSEATESIQQLPKKSHQKHSKQSFNKSFTGSQPQFKPPTPPDPIPEPPSISSSVRSSLMDNVMPPPPPVDLYHDIDRNVNGNNVSNVNQRPKPQVKPKPAIKPKPKLQVNEQTVPTKSMTSRQQDARRYDDIL